MAVFRFSVNGKECKVDTDPDRPLLDVLREDLGLTGTKYGCGEGQCRACTVLVDGKPATSCILPVRSAAGKKIATIESLASNGKLHRLQQAFIEEGAIQCGYCTPGMILRAASLLDANPRPSEAQIVEYMDGNVCRCCGYPRIIAAVQRAAQAKEGSNGAA